MGGSELPGGRVRLINGPAKFTVQDDERPRGASSRVERRRDDELTQALDRQPARAAHFGDPICRGSASLGMLQFAQIRKRVTDRRVGVVEPLTIVKNARHVHE